jgi:hypothetical protein
VNNNVDKRQVNRSYDISQIDFQNSTQSNPYNYPYIHTNIYDPRMMSGLPTRTNKSFDGLNSQNLYVHTPVSQESSQEQQAKRKFAIFNQQKKKNSFSDYNGLNYQTEADSDNTVKQRPTIINQKIGVNKDKRSSSM